MNLKLKKPKLNLASRKAPATFRELVDEAVRVTLELNEISSSNGRRLSPKALVRETLAVCNSDLGKIRALRKAMEDRDPGLHRTQDALRNMIKSVRGPNWAFPPKDPRRVKVLSNIEADAELARRGNSPAELFCVAVQIAGEKYPDDFGTNESSSNWESRVEDLTRRQRELFQRIPSSIGASDLDVGKANDKGEAKVSFKISNGAVPIAPLEDAGNRLTNFMIANRGLH